MRMVGRLIPSRILSMAITKKNPTPKATVPMITALGIVGT